MLKKTISFAIVILACGCSGFHLVEKNFNSNGKTIAVVAGIDNEMNEQVAVSLTESLKNQTKFRTVPQSTVKKLIQNYPSKIKGPYKAAYLEIETDYDNTDTQKIKEIQNKLNVDFVYVIWAPLVVRQGAFNRIDIISQMYEGSSLKEVGRGEFYALSAAEGATVIGPSIDMKTSIGNATDKVALQIAQVMKKEK